jgi:hypothetical protein
VVLTDHTDTPNGWATPRPYNLIVIAAAAPSGAEFIGNTTDWLRMVFTHEFTHIVHLDQSHGWARGVRNVFGRVPLAFPNLFLPTWQIEGIATFYEGSAEREGRLYSHDFREIERAPAGAGRTFPLDRANGGLTAWPSGQASYAHGVGFHRYLSTQFGDDRFGELSRRSAGRVPYTAAHSFTHVYGESLRRLWADYQRGNIHEASSRETDDRAVQLTHDGFVALGPRFAPATCSACPQEIVYSARTPHEFPALMLIRPGRERALPIATRYLGSTSAVGLDTVLFDQQELRRNTGLYSDLFALDRASGQVRPLTREARLADPDVMWNGRRLVAVRQDRGRRDLVTADLGERLVPGPLTVVATERETQFAAPRWSPDGRLIAAERRRLGAGSEIVVIDPATGSTRIVATGATRAVTPAWRPDGRAIVAAADSPDGPFRLFEFDLDAAHAAAPRPLTARQALWPDVSADGRTIAFVGMTEKGFDVFTVPYPTEAVPIRPLPSPDDWATRTVVRDSAPPPAQTPPVDARAYRPWRTLVPTAWVPTLSGEQRAARVGVSTGMVDPLGYHAYDASVTWLVGGRETSGRPGRGEPDWNLSYAYDRWRPRLFGAVSKTTAFVIASPESGGGFATLREHRKEVGVLLPVRRARWTQRALLSGRHESGHLFAAHDTEDVGRVALRAGWALNTSQVYGYSISPEQGVSVGVTAEASGADARSIGDGVTLKGDARAYLPGLAAHHVLAVRAAGARSNGARGVRRTFGLGAATGASDVLDLGVDAISLLRGFPADRFAGPKVGLVNTDYRWPLARVERGVGTWPIFLHTIHAALYADVGHAWTGAFRRRDLKTALGAELAANIVAGYSLPLTITAGVAWRRDPSRTVESGGAAYMRLGKAF